MGSHDVAGNHDAGQSTPAMGQPFAGVYVDGHERAAIGAVRRRCRVPFHRYVAAGYHAASAIAASGPAPTCCQP